MKTFTLNNGSKITAPGYGTYLLEKEITAQCVSQAIEVGYRHIDTAAIYQNEVEVGEGIKNSGIAREELFLTSKVWNTERGYHSTLKAFEKSCKDLQVEYLDLCLIHWPAISKQFDNWQELNSETWRALETLYQEKKVKAIGLSNFLPHHIQALLETAKVLPMVNQIEYHPGFQQAQVLNFCKARDIQVQGWGALGQSRILDNPELKAIAHLHKVTVAQLCIQWSIQNEVIPIVKSAKLERIKENFSIDNFTLSAKDMETINALPEQGATGLNPDDIDF